MGVAPLPPGEPEPSGPLEPERVIATVRALVHEFELVHLQGPDGLTLSIGKRTPGVTWRDLKLGQRLECEIEGEHATRVVRAKLLPETANDAPPEADMKPIHRVTPAMCPACRVLYRVVGPSSLGGLSEVHAYGLTHCRICETSSGHFLPLKDTPDTPADELGYPSAVVPVFDGRYGDWGLATPPQIATCAEAGLRVRLIHRLADEMRVPRELLASWIDMEDSEALSSPARKTLGVAAAERLLTIAKLIGLLQIRTDGAGTLALFDAAPWIGHWLQQPHPELGGDPPSAYLASPEQRQALVKLSARAQLGSEP